MNRKSFLKKLLGAGVATVAVSKISASTNMNELTQSIKRVGSTAEETGEAFDKVENIIKPVAFEEQETETRSESDFVVITTTKKKGVFYVRKME